MPKLISAKEVRRRINKGCPTCGPMYYDHETEIDSNSQWVKITFTCHQCIHTYGTVKYISPERH